MCLYASISAESNVYLLSECVHMCQTSFVTTSYLCTASMPAFVCECFFFLFLFFLFLCFPSVCLSSGPSLVRAPHVRVLYAQHNVVVGAGARVLAQQSSRLQQCSLARHRHVGCAPRLAVVSGQTDAHGAGAVPHQLLGPAETLRTSEWSLLSP